MESFQDKIFSGEKYDELEARFGLFKNVKNGLVFQNGITRKQFYMVLSFMRNYYSNLEKVEHSIVSRSGNIRKIEYMYANESGSSDTSESSRVIWEQKVKVKDVDMMDYGVRISMSREDKISEPKEFTVDNIRNRTRYFFQMKDYRVDLTSVMMTKTNEPGSSGMSYEMEIEFTGKNFNPVIFLEVVDEYYRLIKDSMLTYTENEKRDVEQSLINYLGPLNKGIVVEAHTLEINHVTSSIILDPKVRYVASDKADGFRKLLYFHSTGIWMIYPFGPNPEYNLLSRTYISELDGTLLDGEQICVKDKNCYRGDYAYLAFDCIMYKGDKDIQKKNYTERRRIIDLVIEESIVDIRNMEIFSFDTAEEFFSTNIKILNSTPQYNRDGLVYRPVNVPYNTYNTKDSKYKIFKYKSPQDQTMDFRIIKKINGNIELQYSTIENKKVTHVPFKGTKLNPFTGKVKITEELEKAISGEIWEFMWNGSEMIPIKPRFDKQDANRKSTIESIWNVIVNPMTVEDITGKTSLFLEAYHDRIMTNMIKEAKGNIVVFTRNNNYLDSLAINVFVQKNNKITQIQSDKIKYFDGLSLDITNKIDEIYLYDIEQYWKSQQELRKLIAFIRKVSRPTVRIFFFYPDKVTAEEMLNPTFSRKEDDYNIDIVKDKGGNKLIFEGKEVYLCQITDIVIEIPEFSIKSIYRADQEMMMRETDRKFSSIFSYGMMERIGKKSLKVERNVRVPTDLGDNLSSLGDDQVQNLKCDWFSNLVRIGCIGDGSCFVHSFCKGVVKQYQDNTIDRKLFVKKLRRDVGMKIMQEDPRHPPFHLWTTINNGNYLELLKDEIKNNSMIKDVNIDYSPEGIKYLMNSSAYLGDETYGLFSSIFNIDIAVFVGKERGLVQHVATFIKDVNRNLVVILGMENHYELVGVKSSKGIKVMFNEDDDFYHAVRKFFTDNDNYYNPRESLNSFVADMDSQGVSMQKLEEIFGDSNPLILDIKSLEQ